MIIKRIVVLEPDVANKIAAGEVVERPASVVKELVENSLDADATAVTVEIRGGGIEYIRVTDNGCGIPSEDVAKAFLRHSTSKLLNADGLDNVETFGFRGEALASIAAVSKVALRTAVEGEECGTLLSVEGGACGECLPCGCPIGTSIEVRELFFNVPARLKFLKSPRNETAAVGDYMCRLILANPTVSIKFIANGKTVYHSSGNGSLTDAILCVYGNDINGHIMPVSHDDGYCFIDGFCGDAYLSRSNRVQQSLFINGRYIRSQAVSYAVQRAYDTRIMQGRFPLFVLNIRLSPREVDVNVHPNKLTVRFRDEERICHAVSAAVRAALNEDVSVPMADIVPTFDEKPEKLERVDPYELFKKRADDSPQAMAVERDMPIIQNKPINDRLYLHDSASSVPAPSDYEIATAPHYTFTVDESAKTDAQQTRIEFDGSPYTVIGAAFNTYIIVQQCDNIFIIDQHAAHERILYEKLIARTLRFEAQLMASPLPIRLTPTEYAAVQENIERFDELGFEVEDIGNLTINIHSAPLGVSLSRVEPMLRDMIAVIRKQGSVSELEMVRSALIQTACKHAVKAGDRLDAAEIESILACYANGDTPFTCPHGRPVMICLTRRELEKMFKRVL